MFTAVDLDQLNQRGDDELDSLVTDMADSLGGAQSAALLFRRLLAAERLPLDTASARSLPAFTFEMLSSTVAKETCT